MTTNLAPAARPTLDLTRSVPFTFARAAEDTEQGDGLTLSGHAAVFGQQTEINSWEGYFLESIRAGAFKKTIRERTPVLQFEHGRHALIGSMPIGAITDLREDTEGLYVEARLSDNWLIQPVRDAIAERSITGMSFRFGVVREEWRDAQGKVIKDDDELRRLLWYPEREENVDRVPVSRELIELKVPELGPVVFPAYEGSSVDVRAADIARTVRTDDHVRQRVQRSLATQTDRSLPADALAGDAELRQQVAIAVLFPDATRVRSADGLIYPAAPPAGHPADASHIERSPADPPGEIPAAVRTATPDAPAAGHPSSTTTTPDAPPAAGHPSQTDQDARRQYARRAYVTLHRVGKRY